jgi:hypothetical protein
MAGVKLVLAALAASALVSARDAGAAEPSADELQPAEPRRNEDDEELPRPLLAMAAGAAASFVSLTAGVMVVARSEDRGTKNLGLLGAQTGLCLSPIIAHALVGELKRGAFFALFPLVAELGTATVMAFVPNVITRASAPIQYTTFMLITASVFASTLGVLDAVRVGERRPARAADRPTATKVSVLRGLSISASFDRELTGAFVGGSL